MDRISDLSDDLLLKIVSSLPTKNVVATMLLSKRWRFIWTMLPSLDFDYGSDSEIEPSEYGKFIKYVDRTMVLNRAPVLETLKFKVGPCYGSEDLGTWIRIGMVRGVLELETVQDYEFDDSIELPMTLYTYEKLEVLKLTRAIVVDVPDDVWFPSLKTLHLVSVKYKTKETHRKLLPGCPVLEDLVLDKTLNGFDVGSIYVDVPSLQRLSILDTYEEANQGDPAVGLCMIVMNVPSLKYLNFVDTFGDLCLCENMPEVVEANVRVVYEDPKKLLESIPSVKRLYLCLSASLETIKQFVSQHRVGFHHLLHLELCGGCEGWWDLLTWMLESSPKLQRNNGFYEGISRIKGQWRGPTSVPGCLMFHLHTFKWEDYESKDQEKRILTYILKNARQLTTADISSWRSYSGDLNELVSLPRASSSCQLMVNGEKLVAACSNKI
ncbi:unnamed protein product [Microthlaspi erraticum]|uniref:FBD domain-containing protein n=1 Tax=Microthlaspi erraticum TaxID=1685480 RepID=A0A6D2I7R8_9BRAS|nr:unnamed protein product [Microthlaspi erraticum]